MPVTYQLDTFYQSDNDQSLYYLHLRQMNNYIHETIHIYIQFSQKVNEFYTNSYYNYYGISAIII